MMLYKPLNTFQLIQPPRVVQIKILSSGGSGMCLYSIQFAEQRLKEIQQCPFFIAEHNTG